MTKPTDSDELARRFLDLWQDQAQAITMDLSKQTGFSKLVKDLGQMSGSSGSMADLTSCWMASWPAMVVAATQAMTAAEGKQDEDDSSSHTPAAGSPAPAASSGDSLHDLDQLLRRLDAMEKRLAELEASCAAPKERGRRRS